MIGINKDFERNLETCTSEFRENLATYSEIISIHHTDADGISSGAIMKSMLGRVKRPHRLVANNLKLNWTDFLNNIVPTIKPQTAIFFSDLCPNAAELLAFLKKCPKVHIYILDHHIFPVKKEEILPDFVYNCNPTQYGLNGLKEIAGSTLNYLFASHLDDRNRDLGWIAAIGMGGDVLDRFDEYESYNRFVIEEAREYQLVDVKEGLCAFGGMYETIPKALTMSVFPYFPTIGGNLEKAKTLVKQLGIHHLKKLEDLEPEEVALLSNSLTPKAKGHYITLPQKSGLLHFTFEHANLISFIGYEKINDALQMIGQRNATADQKKAYIDNNTVLIQNLTAFVNLQKRETKFSIIADTTNKIDSKFWSDTASFASVNLIFDPNKVLILGGLETVQNNQNQQNISQMKLSLRCSGEFLNKHHQKGANSIISELMKQIGGTGGGHPLAAGYRVDSKNFQKIPGIIDAIIEGL